MIAGVGRMVTLLRRKLESVRDGWLVWAEIAIFVVIALLSMTDLLESG